MKKYFFAGFITLLPIALTLMIAIWLFNLFTAPFAGIIETIILTYEKSFGLSLGSHEKLVFFFSRIFALIFLFLLIFALGIFGRRFFFSLFLRITDKIFSRIPLVKTIYRLSLDVTKAVFSENTKTFKETVLVPFPYPPSHAIGFTTGGVPKEFGEKTQAEIAVFVPTAPHPMSGFILLTPKNMTVPVDVSIEDAFKFLISCGVIHPGEGGSGQKRE